MLKPSSRLSDDLYMLYLSVLAWFFLPFYGAILTEVVPSQWDHYDRAFDIAVVLAGLMGAWSGVRGGPLMITRSVIIHELGSPMSRRRLLLPWLLRQTAAWAVVAAVAATVALVLADKDSFGYPTALSASAAALLATASASCLATICMVATHGARKHRWPLAGTATAIAITPLIAVVLGVSFLTGIGLSILAATTAVTAAVAVLALATAPVAPLWRRATAIEAMRSSLQQVDFQRVLLELRSAAERPPYATGLTLTRRWMPLPLWRHVASIQHTLGWHIARLLTFIAFIGTMFWLSDPSQGIVALAMAACALLIGLELAGSVAATADQMTFIVHYPYRSTRVLTGQVVTTLLLAVALVAVVIVGGLGSGWRLVAGTLLICALGALGATVQARLGSPDVAAMLQKYGPTSVGQVLWLRALTGPLLVLVGTVAVFHQFLRPEPLSPWLYAVIALSLTVAFVMSRDPLERSIQQGSTTAR